METTADLYRDIPITLTVKDLQRYLRVSLGVAYDLVNSGQIKAITVGRQLRIPKREFIRFLEK